MVSAATIVLEYVCPTFGVVLAILVCSAPVRSLREALSRGSLDELNPTPWAFMSANAMGWVLYSYLTHDWFVFFANAPGLALSIWLNTGAAKLQYLDRFRQRIKDIQVNAVNSSGLDEGKAPSHKPPGNGAAVFRHSSTVSTNDACSGQNNAETNAEAMDVDYDTRNSTLRSLWSSFVPHERTVMILMFCWIFVLTLVFMQPCPPHELYSHRLQRESTVIGIVNNVVLVFFYGAPLSTVFKILRERNTSSLHVRTMITNTMCSAFWSAYGVARLDPYLVIPNACGVLLGLFQFLLFLVFPRKGIHLVSVMEEEEEEMHHKSPPPGAPQGPFRIDDDDDDLENPVDIANGGFEYDLTSSRTMVVDGSMD